MKSVQVNDRLGTARVKYIALGEEDSWDLKLIFLHHQVKSDDKSRVNLCTAARVNKYTFVLGTKDETICAKEMCRGKDSSIVGSEWVNFIHLTLKII